jgi:hypothetical protein
MGLCSSCDIPPRKEVAQRFPLAPPPEEPADDDGGPYQFLHILQPDERIKVTYLVSVQRGRPPLVSIPPLQAHCSSTTSVRLNFLAHNS